MHSLKVNSFNASNLLWYLSSYVNIQARFLLSLWFKIVQILGVAYLYIYMWVCILLAFSAVTEVRLQLIIAKMCLLKCHISCSFSYDAWVIYNFLSLCLAWVGGPGAVVVSLSGRTLKPSWILMTCCYPAIPLDGCVSFLGAY